MSAPATGFTVVWACLCSDAADEVADLPDACPGHGSERVAPPVANPLPGSVATGHQCGERRCDDERNDMTHGEQAAAVAGTEEA